jgi:lipid-binding SYLF domain-containing protein
MTRIFLSVLAAALLACVPAATLAQRSDESDEARRLREAYIVFGEIMTAADDAIPRALLGNADGIAVFPGTVRAGFIFGGMRGRGILSARTETGWSAPAFLTITGGSFGLQIGGQAVDLILVIKNRRGLENLVSNQFKLGADAAVAAGPLGREVEASTYLQLRAQILSYSRARGLFAGVTVNGSTVRQDRDANERFYGEQLETQEIVFGAAVVEPPEPVALWLETLDRFAR